MRHVRPEPRQSVSAVPSRQTWPQKALLLHTEAHDWHTPKLPQVLDALKPHAVSQRDVAVQT